MTRDLRPSANFASYLNAFSSWDDVLKDLPSVTQSLAARRMVRELMTRHASPTTVLQEVGTSSVEAQADVRSRLPARESVAMPRELSISFARFLNVFEDWDEALEAIPRFTRAPEALSLARRLMRLVARPCDVLAHVAGNGNRPSLKLVS